MKIDEKRKYLVESLKKQGIIKTKEIEKAFLEIPREKFIPTIFEQHAYSDTPLEIGQGQTISAPHMIAIMCEELDLKKDQKILEIGTRNGRTTINLAKFSPATPIEATLIERSPWSFLNTSSVSQVDRPQRCEASLISACSSLISRYTFLSEDP